MRGIQPHAWVHFANRRLIDIDWPGENHFFPGLFNPTMVSADMRKLTYTDGVFGGQSSQGYASFSFCSYLTNNFPSQFCLRAFFSLKAMSGKVIFPLCRHLTHVFKLITKRQMRRINALRVCATRANMKDHLPVRDWTSKKNPRCAMRVNLGVDPLASLNHSMALRPSFSTRARASLPQPMRVGFKHLAYKPLWKRWGQVLTTKVVRVSVHLFDIHQMLDRLLEVTGLAGALPLFSHNPSVNSI